jgi:hypothetical protein
VEGKEDVDRRQNAQDPAARRGAFYGRCSSSGSLRPKRMGEATGRQSGALYGLWSFRRTSSGSLAEFAAMRRALAVHFYDHQHLEARPWIRTKALRSCTTAAYALRHRAARTVAKFRPPEARR